MRRAAVTLTPTQRDNDLWAAMDARHDEGRRRVRATARRSRRSGHDGLGTTHHEAGTLWMGTDPTRERHRCGRALPSHREPLCGGPGALSRASARPTRCSPASRCRAAPAIASWRHRRSPATRASRCCSTARRSATGRCRRSATSPGATIPASSWCAAARSRAAPGPTSACCGCTRPTPARYVLRLQWMMTAPDDNSGVFIGFPDPSNEGYDNTAYVGVNFGFEIQIDELARPDNALDPPHRRDLFLQGADDGPLAVASGRRMERLRDHRRWARHHGRAERAGGESVPFHRRSAVAAARAAVHARWIRASSACRRTRGGCFFRHIQWKAL